MHRDLAQQIIAKNPGFVDSLFELGRAKMQSGAFERAAWCFSLVTEIEPLHWNAAVDGALCARELGRLDEAAELLGSVLLRDPTNPWALSGLGFVRQRQGKHELALSYLRRIDQDEPPGVDAKVHSAISLQSLGRFREAADIFGAALNARPNDSFLLMSLADCALNAGDMQKAEEAARRTVELLPREPRPAIVLADALQRLGRGSDALAVLTSAIDRIGDDPDLRAMELVILRSQGRVREARAVAEGFWSRSDLSDLPFGLWFHLTYLAIAIAAFHEAERLLESAPRDTNWQRAETQYLTGLLALVRDDFNAAAAAFDRVEVLEPFKDLSIERARLGLSLLDLAMAKKAVAHKATSRDQEATLNHYKGILDSFERDGDLIGKLRALALLPREDAILPALELARDNPESTAAATLLIQILLLSNPRKTEADGDEVHIPRRIIQYWEHDLPAEVRLLMDEWQGANAEYEYVRFDFESAVEFLRSNFSERVVEGFSKAPRAAFRADIFRYAYLSMNGGIWIDADERCLAPLSEWMPHGARFVGNRTELGIVNNNFIAVEKENPILAIALEGAVRAVCDGSPDTMFLSVSPGRFTKAVSTFFVRCFEQCKIDDFVLFNINEEQLFFSTDFLLPYKRTSQHWWFSEYLTEAK